MQLTAYTSFADAQAQFSMARLWDLFDGDRERLNLAHECVDRHATNDQRVAVRIAHADGRDEVVTFARLAVASSQVAHLLRATGVVPGDRVAIMLEPGLAFYAALFGAIKAGAIAVPLFMLFGPDGLRLRIDDCKPKVLITTADKWAQTLGGEAHARSGGSGGSVDAASMAAATGPRAILVDDAFLASLARYPGTFAWASKADDMAVYQYTSGTTRELPEAVRHTHRAIVVVMIAALYATGIRPGEELFCPSSPAWGHGLWHGTLAPLALGLGIATYAGRFDADRLMRALHDYGSTNLSAAATHYRMMRNAGTASRYAFRLRKLTFTGEPLDSDTRAFARATFGAAPASFYGTTEVGVVLACYPGARDIVVPDGALGLPLPGMKVEVQAPDGRRCEPGVTGEIKLWRRDRWIASKDLGWQDANGWFFHAGRADDVIISAGWTMGAVEIEDILLKHPDVREAAVIGVPDAVRGQVVKAFIVSPRSGDAAFVAELQEHVRQRLSAHEYPRQVAFATELPRTPAGKINRKALRAQEQRQQGPPAAPSGG